MRICGTKWLIFKNSWSENMSEDIDNFTIHCVERIIKDLIIENEKYQENVMDINHFREYLIFQNRKLVLYEALGKVQNLKIPRNR